MLRTVIIITREQYKGVSRSSLRTRHQIGRETLCHAFPNNPRKFHVASNVCGWVLYPSSTALTTNSGLWSVGNWSGLHSILHNVQAHRLAPFALSFRRHACFQVFPPSADTSTLTIPRPPPLNAYPCTDTGLSAEQRILVIALCTGISCMLCASAQDLAVSCSGLMLGPKHL
jgi:hypothetical protein